MWRLLEAAARFVGLAEKSETLLGDNLAEEPLASERHTSVTCQPVDVLGIREVGDWFQQVCRAHPAERDLKSVLTVPAPELLQTVLRNDIPKPTERYMLQAVVDSTGERTIDARILKYTSIETNLQMQLMDNDNMLIITM